MSMPIVVRVSEIKDTPSVIRVNGKVFKTSK